MKNRPIVVRLRDWFLALPFDQMKSVTKQIVIDAFIADGDDLSIFEVEQLEGKHGIVNSAKWVFNFLKNEWVVSQSDDFIQNRYLPAFKAAINPSLSSYTVRQVYEYTISEGLPEETAQLIHKKAVAVYHEELSNG